MPSTLDLMPLARAYQNLPSLGGSGQETTFIQYTAGYSTIPEDVQEACAELVAS